MAAASVSSHVYASVLLLVITLMTPIYGYNEYLSGKLSRIDFYTDFDLDETCNAHS